MDNNNLLKSNRTRNLAEPNYVDINKCKLSQRCGSCNNSTQVCDNCNSGMVLSAENNICLFPHTIPYCDLYEIYNSSRCLKCKNRYYLNFEGDRCVRYIDNKKECHKTCRHCKEISRLDSIGING